ncbi:MAG: hypothetical protein AB7O73_15445 [Bacteroidia bacterium]
MKNENNLSSQDRREKAKRAMKIAEAQEILIKDVTKNPYVRVIFIGALVYGIIWVSKYFIDTSADAVTAVKKLRSAVRA